jgi:hypothetical protein
MEQRVSKESKIKKRLEDKSKQAATPNPQSGRQPLSAEQRAQIIKERLANRPVIVLRYPNGKLNTRFIYTLAILVVALIAALYIITR